MRASGAGGQHVNTTESAIRIIHIPTGLEVSLMTWHASTQKQVESAWIRGHSIKSIAEG